MKKKGFLILLLLGITIILSAALLLGTPIPSQAEEIRYPVPSYEGEELAKVRQWEKIWVGKKIDPTTIDEVKEFIPESLYQIMSDPDKWGESWFEIVPYREIKPSKGELKFTRKHAGTCSIGPDQELLNHICGIPFPNPKTALEIAYNFDNLNQGDNAHAMEDSRITDGKARYDRKISVEGRFLYFSARREVPPVPELPNPKGIFRATHFQYHEPASSRGTRSLSIKYKDRTKPYESYSFSSTTRKLVRKSTAQREDTGGGDSTRDDSMIYDHDISAMSYKYLGRKELLMSRHQDTELLRKNHREGYCLINGLQRERINTYVLECIHKNPNYLYSKQIWYLDPETWWILYSDKYDRKGNLWRVFENAQFIVKSVYNNTPTASITYVLTVDVQRLHSSGGYSNYVLGETGELFQPDYYTPKALQKYGY